MTEPAIAATESETSATPPPPRRTEPAATATTGAGGWLAFASLLWLLFVLLASRRSLAGDGGTFDIVRASAMVTALIHACMVAGATAGLWLVTTLGRKRDGLDHGYRRILLGAGGGLLTGALASGAVMIAFGVPASAAAVLAILVGVAGGLGGALSTIGPARLAGASAAGITGALTLIIVSYVRPTLVGQTQLVTFFGADGTPERDFAANGLLAGTLALITGVIVGLVAFWRLRRSTRRTGLPLGWPAYAVAGASGGGMLIISELFIRFGAARLLELTSGEATADQIFETMAESSRLNTGIVVFFVGAITAIIAVGRTIPRRSA